MNKKRNKRNKNEKKKGNKNENDKNKRNKDQKEQQKVRICDYNMLGATLNMVNEMWNLKNCAFT